MTNRVYNFNPGPSTLPLSVLEKAQKELLNYNQTGMSIMELSHRTKDFEDIIYGAEDKLKRLLKVGNDYRVLFLQGGASSQFSSIPQNLLRDDMVANYVLTGSFAERAYEEAQLFGKTHIVASSKDDNYNHIPKITKDQLSTNPAYLHITSNNTIFGTQFKEFPVFSNVPLIADMSSDILSKTINGSKFSLIYAGAQKNLGPAGVTVVLIHKDLIAKSNKDLATMQRYDIMAKNDSLYNTPPTFSIYMLNLVLDWIVEQGGTDYFQEFNENKAKLVYDIIDSSNNFYLGHALTKDRSTMNITFNLKDKSLEESFIQEAKKVNIIGIKGHRSVGGMRTSIYNAMPMAGCQALADFMYNFQKSNS